MSNSPADDYAAPHPDNSIGNSRARPSLARSVLRGLSAISACAAVASACVVTVLDWLQVFGPGMLPWRLKSAFPLIFIGIAYGCLQFTLSRSRKEYFLGFCVATAFILWGGEQFVPDPSAALLMDDLVMLLFVLDLGIVVRGYLKQK